MNLEEEIKTLRRHLDELLRDGDDELIRRYELRRPSMPPGLYWRLRWLAGRILRSLNGIKIWRRDSWPVNLKQSKANAKAVPLLIWAVGVERDTLRIACERFSRSPLSRGFAPVLITDVADFAFFSRLGWLVEYVPQLKGEGAPYEERKVRFLARLYHGAPALPLAVLLQADGQVADIRRWLAVSA